MATVGSGVITLADIGKSLDPNGQIAAVIELLSNSHEIIDDMSWMEGNIDTGHRFTQRSSTPKAIAEQHSVNPETGEFPEQFELDQVDKEGRMTAEDHEAMKIANDNYETAKSWGEALRAAVTCLI